MKKYSLLITGLVIYGIGYYGIWGFGTSIAVPMIVIGALIFIIALSKLIIEKEIELKKNYNVFIRVRKRRVFINTDSGMIKYKKTVFNINEITKYKLIKNEKILISSGFGESIVGGILFGGAGAIAGAYAGKKEKQIKECVLYIETNNILYAGITIPVSEESGFKICRVFEVAKQTEKEN